MEYVIVPDAHRSRPVTLAKLLVSKFSAALAFKAISREIYLARLAKHLEDLSYWQTVEGEIGKLSSLATSDFDETPLSASPEESRRLVAIFARLRDSHSRQKVVELAQTLLRLQPISGP